MQTIRRSHVGALAVLLCTVVIFAGCKNEPREQLASIKGKALVDGKPVPTGNVTFYPDLAKGNESGHQPMGTIDKNGNYEVFVPGGRKGAPLGWYKVVVYAVDDPQPGKPNKYFVHAEYADVATTPLTIEVVANPEPGRYDLKLRP